LKNFLLYIIILSSLPLKAQVSVQRDTVKIMEVIISNKRVANDLTGYKKNIIDSSVLKNFSNGSLAEMLSSNSLIYIKCYGMGGTATPSFRGTGANHTQVAWNNINLNNPMPGQSDFTLIPAGLADEIQIYSGGASMLLNSGGIGGIINLETKPVWKNETVISISPGLGSFGRYTGLMQVRSGTSAFQSVTKAFIQSSENDFRYLNNEIGAVPVWETRKNSQIHQQGFIEELYFRKTKNTASARIWYQSSGRNLPSTMLSQQVNTGEKQTDESLRALMNYEVPRGRTDYFFTGALLLNRLIYTNRLASVNSVNASNTTIIKAVMESYLTEHTRLKAELNEELTFIKSNNYDNSISRNTAMATVTAELNDNDRFGATVLIREIFDKNRILIPDFSAGFQFRIRDEKEYFLKANISRNSKIPTMNDLFWMPGGNPGLKNEYAYMYELSYDMKQKVSTVMSLASDITVFQNRMKDMIQWHPGIYSFWTADNIQNVNSEGIETSLAIDYKKNGIIARFKAEYSFIKANIAGSDQNSNNLTGKQLMYIPENQANASIRIGYRNFYSSWISNFTGRRFISADNSRYLPPYLLNDIITGCKINFKGSYIDINFDVENIFNVSYQAVAFYPLPGRSYSLKLLIQIVK
jgi:outer membrane cobalamin receptor